MAELWSETVAAHAGSGLVSPCCSLQIILSASAAPAQNFLAFQSYMACPPNLAPPCGTASDFPIISCLICNSSCVLPLFYLIPNLHSSSPSCGFCYFLQQSCHSFRTGDYSTDKLRVFSLFPLVSSFSFLSYSQLHHRCIVSSHSR